MAKTNPKLAMLDPITFPKAKSACPSKADLTLTINSGTEVANETTVIPITILGTFKRKEKPTADFSNQFPPRINKNNPITTNNKFIKILFANINELLSNYPST